VISGAPIALVATIAIALSWRSAWAPAAGALVGVAIATATGAAGPDDALTAARDLWRPLLAIVGVMTTAACAGRLGVFASLAAWIEPRTRGPVKHGFRTVFALSAIVAALLSNDAAILMFTPVVIELIIALYPKRHPKLLVPFSFAVFVAAGVAPFPTGNPMNLVVAERAGIDFNEYAARMVPVAIAGWIVAYALLAWCFRGELDDEKPAWGRMRTVLPVGASGKLVLAIVGASVLAYPVMAWFEAPLWAVAVPAALGCVACARRDGVAVSEIFSDVSWELVPFVFGMFVLATALARAGITEDLHTAYTGSPWPMATVGTVSTAGSALINNHPMALLNSVTLGRDDHRLVLAALVGGDLGPRILPIGSLAGLLWMHQLRRRGIVISRRTFARVGLVVTIPSLVVSLIVLKLVA
jgi:arsenical pump membrane protein